jgi:two-component system LytT family response regulator
MRGPSNARQAVEPAASLSVRNNLGRLDSLPYIPAKRALLMAEAKIPALIVDDEPPARAVIRRMLKEDPQIEMIGECANGREAIKALRRQPPDVLFLDIQMPEMDGFALLEALDEERMPVVIFVTAYNHYAVRAFEVAATDYLLKPFDHERLAKALQRAKLNLREKSREDRSQQMLALLRQLHAQSEYLDRFVIKHQGRVLLIPADEVDWLEAEGNYLLLPVGRAAHLIRETRRNLERRLNPRKFLRIHRSRMGNIDRVKELHVHVNREEQLVILKDGSQLRLSRRYREKVSRILGAAI